MQGKRQDVYVVGIPSSDASIGFAQLFLVLWRLDERDRQGGELEQEGVQAERFELTAALRSTRAR